MNKGKRSGDFYSESERKDFIRNRLNLLKFSNFSKNSSFLIFMNFQAFLYLFAISQNKTTIQYLKFSENLSDGFLFSHYFGSFFRPWYERHCFELKIKMKFSSHALESSFLFFSVEGSRLSTFSTKFLIQWKSVDVNSVNRIIDNI